jgi:hypothetical protein
MSEKVIWISLLVIGVETNVFRQGYCHDLDCQAIVETSFQPYQYSISQTETLNVAKCRKCPKR